MADPFADPFATPAEQALGGEQLAGDVVPGPPQWGTAPHPTPEDRVRALEQILRGPGKPLPAPLPIGPQGPTPKQGQVVPPTDVAGGIARAREGAIELGAELTGAADVRRVLSGETPVFEAIGAAVPMALGGPETRLAPKELGAAMSKLAATAPEYLNPLTHMPIKGPAFERAMREANAYLATLPKGHGPLDLSNVAPVPNVPQLELQRYVPPRGVSERMQTALQNPDVIAGVRQSIEQGSD